jgi:hypothetical protein
MDLVLEGGVIMDRTKWPSRLSFDVEFLPLKLCPVERTELPSAPPPAERARPDPIPAGD